MPYCELAVWFSSTAPEPGVYSGVTPHPEQELEATASVVEPVSTRSWKLCNPTVAWAV